MSKKEKVLVFTNIITAILLVVCGGALLLIKLNDKTARCVDAPEIKEDTTTEKNPQTELVEVAEEIGIPLREVACALDAVSDTVSFFDPVFGEDDPDGLLIVDQIADPRENPDRWTENIALNEALKFVQDREKTILVLRYYEGKTQVEISQITGISQAQVSRIEKSAIGKLKKCLGVE